MFLPEAAFCARYDILVKPSAWTDIIVIGEFETESFCAFYNITVCGYPRVFVLRGGIKEWFGKDYKQMWVMTHIPYTEVAAKVRQLKGDPDEEIPGTETVK